MGSIDNDRSARGSAEIIRLVKYCKYVLLITLILLFGLIWDPIVKCPVRGVSDSGQVWLFALCTVFPITAAIAFIIVTAFLLYAIKRKKHYSLCLKISWVLFVFIPIGAFLGVYALRVLKKPEVRVSFGYTVMEPIDANWELNIISVLNNALGALLLIHLTLLLYEIGGVLGELPMALKVLCLAFSLILMLLSLGSFFVGWAAAKRRHYRLCRILSALNCIASPFGTLIGVYSLIILNRQSTQSS